MTDRRDHVRPRRRDRGPGPDDDRAAGPPHARRRRRQAARPSSASATSSSTGSTSCRPSATNSLATSSSSRAWLTCPDARLTVGGMRTRGGERRRGRADGCPTATSRLGPVPARPAARRGRHGGRAPRPGPRAGRSRSRCCARTSPTTPTPAPGWRARSRPWPGSATRGWLRSSTPTLDGARPYIVTRYVPGPPLDGWSPTPGRCAATRCCGSGAGSSEALTPSTRQGSSTGTSSRRTC